MTHCKSFQSEGYTLTPTHPETPWKWRNICWLFVVLLSQGRAFMEIMDQHFKSRAFDDVDAFGLFLFGLWSVIQPFQCTFDACVSSCADRAPCVMLHHDVCERAKRTASEPDMKPLPKHMHACCKTNTQASNPETQLCSMVNDEAL